MTIRRPPSTSELAAHAIELIQTGKMQQAKRMLKDVLKADPNHFDGLQALAVIHAMAHQYTDAARLLTRALQKQPDFVPALLNLGTAKLMLNQPAEAEAAFARAVVSDPGNAKAHELLGQSRQSQGKLPEAIASFSEAARLDPSNFTALTHAVAMKQKTCDWDGLARFEQSLLTAATKAPETGRTVEPFLLLNICDDPVLQKRNAAIHWRRVITEPHAPRHARKPRPRRTSARIRLAYLSADFRQHAMAHLIAELIELHDRSRFELFGFSYGPDDGSAARARLAKGFDRFIDVKAATDEQFAARMAACEIDIAVDLAGHTLGARLGVFEYRSAPVQCHYLGFPGTSGGTAIDYFIADRVTAPHGADIHFTEKLVRLPDCYLVNDRKRVAYPHPITRADCGLPDDAFVFASFNGQQKLTSQTFDIWARILAAVPRALLWLYCDVPRAQDNLRREAASRGIDPARLVFAVKMPADRHLARMPLADLFLDCLPYCAHTTGCDALWMGLPVLTCPGRAFAGRVGASLLAAAGMPELIAADLAEYESMAIALASDPGRLGTLRQRLVATRDTMPLFDTDRFRRSMENAYQQMWARHTAGLPPASIDVTN